MIQNKKFKTQVLAFLAAGSLLGGGYGGWRYFFPIESTETLQQASLWRHGVEEVTQAGVHAYSQDYCAKEQGTCSCLLLVHGMGDVAMTWKKILQAPRSKWLSPVRIYAVDLPGSGESPAPTDPSGYRARKLAQSLTTFIQELEPSRSCAKWTVVGNSFGGWVAAWMALDSGERVQKLVLVDSAGLKEQAERTERVGSLLSEPTVESLKDFQRRAYARPRELPEFAWKAAVERVRKSNSKELMKAQVPEDYLDTYLPSLGIPTLVYWGVADRILPITDKRIFTTQIPGAVSREVSECGHLPQKECAEDLLRSLSEWTRY